MTPPSHAEPSGRPTTSDPVAVSRLPLILAATSLLIGGCAVLGLMWLTVMRTDLGVENAGGEFALGILAAVSPLICGGLLLMAVRAAGLRAYGLGLLVFGTPLLIAVAAGPAVPRLLEPGKLMAGIILVGLVLGLLSRLGRLAGSRAVNAMILGGAVYLGIAGVLVAVTPATGFGWRAAASVAIVLTLMPVAAGLVTSALVGPPLVALIVLLRRRITAPPDGRLQRLPFRRTLAQLRVAVGVALLFTLGWAWIWLAPIDAAESPTIRSFRAEWRTTGVARTDNAYWDYLDLPETNGMWPPNVNAEKFIVLEDADGVIARAYDPAPAVAALAANADVIAAWESARSRPAARGDWDPASGDPPPPTTALFHAAKMWLNGTVHDPDAFVDTLAAIHHAADTLISDGGSLVDAAVSVVLAGVAFRMVPQHLALVRPRLTADHYDRLSAVLDRFVATTRRSRDRFVAAELLAVGFFGRAQMEKAGVPDLLIDGIVSRYALSVRPTAEALLRSAGMPNHAILRDGALAILPVPAEVAWRIPPMLGFEKTLPIYRSMIFDQRRVETRARILRLMVAIEADRRLGLPIPASTSALIERFGDRAIDDWSETEPFAIDSVTVPATEPGYTLSTPGPGSDPIEYTLPPALGAAPPSRR
jgi:hypothetical protein